MEIYTRGEWDKSNENARPSHNGGRTQCKGSLVSRLVSLHAEKRGPWKKRMNEPIRKFGYGNVNRDAKLQRRTLKLQAMQIPRGARLEDQGRKTTGVG